ncbi:MAG: AAA family ATPase [Nitrospiraceae bacterium]|nr:AAA family ATPase [Nitrospiraceae bacterium]
MYLAFYGLRKEPFHITPDPEFLYLSPSHKEAYAAVVYGVKQRKGFVTLTGEVGTGKTTILRSYLKKLDRDEVRPIYLFNPDLTFRELLCMLLHEMGMDSEGRSEAWMLQWFHWALIQEYQANRNVVVIIDEAQNMPVETLEKLRMLTNIETAKDKLLQIVLVGQPELEEKLNLYSLRQLKQRVAMSARIRALTKTETKAYIRHRVTQAMGSTERLFDAAAFRAVVRHGKGNPRQINILCDNALVTGFGYQQRPVTAKIVRDVVAEIRGGKWRRYGRWLGASATAALLLVGALVLASVGRGGDERPSDTSAAMPVAHAETVVMPAPEPRPAPEPAPERAVVHTQVALDAMMKIDAGLERPTAAAPLPPDLTEPAASPKPVARPEAALAAEMAMPVAPMENDAAPDVAAAVPPVMDGGVENGTPALAEAARPVLAAGPTRRVVKRGENLSRLVMEVYGRCDTALIEWVRASNPRVGNADLVLAGDTIVFPDIRTYRPAEDAAGNRDSS